MKKFIGTKDFYKQVFVIIIPIMIQQLFLSLAGYIDSVMINGYGATGIAYNGVSAANRLMFVCSFVWMAFATTASIFISQYFGAKNKDKINEELRLGLVVASIFAVVGFIVIHLFGNNIVDIFIQDQASRNFGYDYIKYIKYDAFVLPFIMMFANSYRSVKRPTVAMIDSIIGIVVNIALNYCMIYGNFGFPELGAAGAAIATVISKVVELAIYIGIILLDKKSVFYGCFKNPYISKELTKLYIKKGVPLVLNELLWTIGMITLARFYTYKNDVWYNAYAYTQNISDLFFIVFGGLASSTAVIIGSKLGNNELDEAVHYADYFKGLGLAMGLVVGGLMAATSPLTVLVFNPDATTKALMIKIICITSIFTAIYCYNSVCFFTLRAGGDAVRAFIVDQVPTYLLAIPISMIFGINSSKWGLTIVEVYLFTHFSDIAKIFIANNFVNKKKWVVNLTIENK